MIKKLLPIILLLVGAGAGAGAGMLLRPVPNPDMVEADVAAKPDETIEEASVEAVTSDYVRMSNQFVVPVVEKEQVAALVVMSLSLEVPTGQQEIVYSREPKLRDSFLQVMFDHANNGGFNGAFTNANNMDVLRQALREVARKDLGDTVTDVLILEIARQDY